MRIQQRNIWGDSRPAFLDHSKAASVGSRSWHSESWEQRNKWSLGAGYETKDGHVTLGFAVSWAHPTWNLHRPFGYNHDLYKSVIYPTDIKHSDEDLYATIIKLEQRITELEKRLNQ